MNQLISFVGILLVYLTIGSSVVLGLLCWRLKDRIGAILCGVAALVPLRLLLDESMTLLAGCSVVLAGLLGYYLAVVRPRQKWHDVKAARAIRRQVALHMILVTGSALFLMPFMWLVVTSLKEDEDMSKFPPVWIPRQQVKIPMDGKPTGLAMADYEGHRVKVAVLKEMESGERHLRVLEPPSLAGREFDLPRKQVEKIKQFGPLWKNYPDALKFLPPETRHGIVFMTNTIVLSCLAVLGTLISGSLVAFSFARLKWPGRDTLFVILLATMMLPGAVTMMPVFLVFRSLGWIDSLKPLWAPAFVASMTSGFNSAFYIFLMRQFFLTIPNDLEDAAKIDGCSYFGIYSRIMLPLVKPALAAVTIMTFMASWNNFMGPLIYVSSPTRMPLSYALSLFQTAHGGEPGLLMAAAVMMILPVLMLFFFTQRYFIQGVTLTGIKG